MKISFPMLANGMKLEHLSLGAVAGLRQILSEAYPGFCMRNLLVLHLHHNQLSSANKNQLNRAVNVFLTSWTWVLGVGIRFFFFWYLPLFSQLKKSYIRKRWWGHVTVIYKLLLSTEPICRMVSPLDFRNSMLQALVWIKMLGKQMCQIPPPPSLICWCFSVSLNNFP